MNILICMCPQKDFADKNVLGNDRSAISVPPHIKDTIVQFAKQEEPVYLIIDCHNNDYSSTLEAQLGRPAHCQRMSDGWQLLPQIKNIDYDFRTKFKTAVPMADIVTTLQQLQNEGANIETIHFCGYELSQDILSTAIVCTTFFPQIQVYIHEEACGDSSNVDFERAITTLTDFGCKII